MKKIRTLNGYCYYIGRDNEGRQYYNVVPMSQEIPAGGYYAHEYICGVKRVPNLFK